ncbi:creatininase family protein [Aliihoeflea sp. PC F10.4]
MTASETNAARRIAVLPLGATEQHGPHLPFETDTLIAEAVASRLKDHLAGEIPLDILPVEPVGYSPEHMDVEGSKTLRFDEAVNRWIGIGAQLAAQGTRKFVMLNAHGGNSPLMTVVATELRVRHAMLAVATSWTRFGYPADIVSPHEKAIGIHGGLIETSVMLAIRPDLVDMDKARDFPSAQSRFEKDFTHLRAYGPHAFGWKMSDLSLDGVTGNAAGASADKGERILDHSVAGLADLIRDIDKFDVSSLR